MFKCSLLAFLALSMSGLLGCGDNIDPSGPPVLSSPHLYVTTTQDSAVEIDATATDTLNRTITYTPSTPSHGTITGSGPKFTYTPNAGFFGTDEITITLSNGDHSATVTVSITIDAHDAIPVTADATAYVAQNGAGSIVLTATDTDSPSLTYTVVGTPEHGSLSGDAPNLIYTPDPDYAGADTLTYEASDGMATSNVSTITINVTICGDGTQTPNEECDDGNTVDGDNCSSTCLIERCGDGVLQLGRDESCDDGNTVSDDGCSSDCVVETAVTTTPIMVSGDLVNCTTQISNATHHIAADTADIYGVMLCGTNGYVTVSHDHGNTFSPPLALTVPPPGGSPDSVIHVATSIGVAGTAYVAYMLGSGDVWLKRTVDHGATWSDPALIGTTNNLSIGFSLGSFDHDVFLAISTSAVPPGALLTPTSNAITVFSNHRDGVGAFASVILPTPFVANFDLLYDPTIDVMALATDNVSFNVRVSTDRGASFSSAMAASGAEVTGDWALGGSHLYVSGVDSGATLNSNTLYYYTPALTMTSQTGLPVVTTLRSRSLAADITGNAFIASELDGGGVQLDRFEAGPSGFDSSRSISATGTAPGVTDLRGNAGAGVIYTDAGAVWISVQQYFTCPPLGPC